MAGTIVGIDIGAASVRAVEVHGYDGAKPVIVRHAEVPLPEGSVRRGDVIEVSTVASALKRLWSVGGFREKQVVLGMGGQSVFARDLQVPRAPLQQVRESLPFHVQDLLPVPVTDAILDFYPIGEEAGEHGPAISGLLVAALESAVSANVAAALQAGLRPVHVDFTPFAISRALAPVRSASGRDVLVTIGANTMNVVVVQDGVPQFVRIIPSGSDDITAAIAAQLQWAPEEAEQAKRALGMGGAAIRQQDRPVLEIIYRVVGELLTAIRGTLSYYASSKPSAPFERIVLAGGGSQLIGLPNALAELVRTPIVVADALGPVPFAKGVKSPANPSELAGLTTALGLALGAHS